MNDSKVRTKPNGRCRVYLVGKIGCFDWRHDIFGNRLHQISHGIYHDETNIYFPDDPPTRGGFEYAGPFFLRRGHGNDRHGSEEDYPLGHALDTSPYGGHFGGATDIDSQQVAQACRMWIESADAVFCWMDDAGAYGSILEIGYAAALGKPLVWAETRNDVDLSEMWLAEQFCTGHYHTATALQAFNLWADGFIVEWLKSCDYNRYLNSPHWLETREDTLERCGRRCQLCNGCEYLNVHHRTYERRGREDPSDLTVLCRSCHAKFHNRLPRAA